MALGQALARGIVAGIGDAGNKMVADKREAARDKRKEESAFKLFVKQQDYAAAKQAAVVDNQRKYQEGVTASDRAFQVEQTTLNRNADQANRVQLSNIRTANAIKTSRVQTMLSAASKRFDNTILGDKEYRRLAGMSDKELAASKAHAFAQPFGKDLYGKMYNESLKDSDGRTHAQLIKDNGGVMADYSSFVGTEFESGIPSKGGLAGIDMGSTFAYDVKSSNELFAAETKSLTEGAQKRQEQNLAIESTVKGSMGVAKISPDSLRLLREAADKGPKFVTGEDGTQLDVNVRNSQAYIDSGVMVNDPVLGLITKAEDDDRKALIAAQATEQVQQEGIMMRDVQPVTQAAPEDFSRQPLDIQGGVVGADAQIQSEIQRKRQKEQDVKTSSGIKTINKDNDLEHADQLDEIMVDLGSLDDDQFKAMGVGLAGGSALARDTAAALGSDKAIAAKKVLSKVAFVRNKIRNKLFGATLTDNEQASFNEAWDELGAQTTREGYNQQIKVVQGLIDTKLTSVLAEHDQDTQIDMARRHPQVKRVLIDNLIKDQGLDPARRDEIESVVFGQ